MHRRFYIAVVAGAGILLALLVWQRDRIAEIWSPIAQAVEEVGINLSGNARVSGPTAFQLSAPGEVVAQTSAEIVLAYGSVTIKPGTRLWALRQTEKGVVTRFGREEVTLPVTLFRPPDAAKSAE